MRKQDFKIHIIRGHLYEKNILFIKGMYLNGAENDSKIRIYLDKRELTYKETRISDYDIRNRYVKEDVDVTAGVFLWVDMPEVLQYKKFRVIFECGATSKTIVELTKETIEDMVATTYYNIDVMAKIRNKFMIKGWVIHNNKIGFELTDLKGEKLDIKTVQTKRNDVKVEYPEIRKESRITGFELSFTDNCERLINLDIKRDEEVVRLLTDTKCDFAGNKSILAVIVKGVKKKGAWGSVVWAFRQFRHPIQFLKRFCRVVGITAVIKGSVQLCKRIKKKINAEYILRTEYKDLWKVYPNAIRKMLCLKVLDDVKQEKGHHCTENIKFSILVPLYNTPVNFLREMIESVQIQTYKNWELCLADGSDDKHAYVGEICKKYREKDERIVYKKLEKNLGISGNTNACIEMATGNFIALFDHDDFLHPQVLKKCYEVIEEKHADFVYTDEATFQGDLDNVVTYHFKADYAPDSLRANNYICHFSTFSKEVLDKAGWYDSKYDGSQDHDLILRLTENAHCVEHIQEVLYFWRSHPGSVAEDIGAKTYAIDAGKRAVSASIERCGIPGAVESSEAFPTIYRIKYALKDTPMISVIIPNYNHLEDLQRCVESILERTTYKNYEIIIVENNSTEEEIFEYYDKLKVIPNVKVIVWDKPFNYSAINNYAVQYAKGQYVLFLNNDIEVITPEWMEEMLMYAQREDVAAVGAKLYYPDNTIQHAGIVLGMGAHRVAGHVHYKCDKNNLGYMGRLYYAQNMSAVTAACMLIKKKIFEELNGFDEEFVVAYNDIDLCVKAIEAGYLNVFTPHAELYHYESASRGMEDTPEKQARFNQEVSRFKEKWQNILEAGDKYFNKNFSLDDSWFVINKNDLFKK